MLQAALVSYLNTKPFIQGIEQYFKSDEISLELLPPSQCALSLASRRSNLALVPVGALSSLKGVRVMKDHCIGARGQVDSVFILSTVPVSQITTLVPDADSRTSNLLAKVLTRQVWRLDCHWAEPGLPVGSLAGNEGKAWVCIGDKAMKMRSEFPVVIDLAGVWKKWTGLPFVFAVWAYYPENVSRVTLDKFRLALQAGIGQLEEVSKRWGPVYGLSPEKAYQYLAHNLHYEFDAEMQEGFRRFLREAGELGLW